MGFNPKKWGFFNIHRSMSCTIWKNWRIKTIWLSRYRKYFWQNSRSIYYKNCEQRGKRTQNNKGHMWKTYSKIIFNGEKPIIHATSMFAINIEKSKYFCQNSRFSDFSGRWEIGNHWSNLLEMLLQRTYVASQLAHPHVNHSHDSL